MLGSIFAIIATVGLLAFLECALSIDNAIVLSILVRHLPLDQRKKALTYGLAGAFGFRILGLFALGWLFHFWWVKGIAAGYLLWLASKHFLTTHIPDAVEQTGSRSFWWTIVSVELTDIAFAMDSLFAATALSQRLWVVAVGAMLGIVAIRFAAAGASTLIDKMPTLESTAYQLVALIGVKLLLETFDFSWLDFHDVTEAPFYVFWGLMVVMILQGWRRARRRVA